MGYLDENLMNREALIYRAKLHWVVFGCPVFWLIIVIMIGAIASITSASPLFFVAIAIGVISMIVMAIARTVEYLTSEFGITNKRVIYKSGFIRRNSLEILIHKIESIYVSQGVLGRSMGYGTIMIGGTGGSKDIFPNIPEPLEFRKKVQEQIDNTVNLKVN